MKNRLIIYIVFALLMPLSLVAQTSGSAAKKAAAKKAFTVVIDAGHGGKDPGAQGSIVQEKKLNLDVSLALGKLIEENYPDVKVYYTRTTDVFLTLQERANFVNKHAADLFICVHTNSSQGKSASGTETFVLGINKLQSNLDVAMRENAVMMLEDDQTGYEGFNPNSVDSYIMFELMQDQYIDQSLQFATLVQNEFSGTLGRGDRGVQQAGFWVLHKSACPSVLVEMGFISNPAEERYLASSQGKKEISGAIYNAFVTYKAAIDKKNGVQPRMVHLENLKQKEAALPDTVALPAVDTTAGKPAKAALKPIERTTEKPAEKTAEKIAEKATEKTAEKAEEKVVEQPAREAAAATPEIVYRVQIFTATQQLKSGDPTFKGLKGCKFTRDGKFYKYTYGEETDYTAILAVQKQVKDKFSDCFIVAYKDGQRISVKEARAEQKK